MFDSLNPRLAWLVWLLSGAWQVCLSEIIKNNGLCQEDWLIRTVGLNKSVNTALVPIDNCVIYQMHAVWSALLQAILCGNPPQGSELRASAKMLIYGRPYGNSDIIVSRWPELRGQWEVSVTGASHQHEHSFSYCFWCLLSCSTDGQ